MNNFLNIKFSYVCPIIKQKNKDETFLCESKNMATLHKLYRSQSEIRVVQRSGRGNVDRKFKYQKLEKIFHE